MDNGAEDALVSDLEDELGGEAVGARLEPGGIRVQKSLASPVGGAITGNNAHERSNISVDEPSVTSDETSLTDASSRKQPRRIYRKTLLLLFGQLLAASIFMMGHLFFFLHLDRKLVKDVHVSQPWITATSLLLVTLVKGVLTMCVGTCFVQHLWYILRDRYNSLEDIERMFNLRRSLLGLLDTRTLLRVPLLFSMGGYLWLLNVAFVYPPGALIVSMDGRYSPQSFNMSVLNQTFPDDFDPLDYEDNFPGLGEVDLQVPNIEVLNSSVARINYTNTATKVFKDSMQSYAKFILSAGEIARIEPPPYSRNSSYILEYNAPQLNCTESHSNETVYHRFLSRKYDPSSNLTTTLRSYDPWNFRARPEKLDTFTVDFARYLGYIPQPDYNLSITNSTQFGIAMQIHTLTCQGYSALYRVNITNHDSSQNLTYTVHGNRPLNEPECSFTWIDVNNGLDPKNFEPNYLHDIIPRQSSGFKEWASRQVPEYLRAINTMNLYQYVLDSIAGICSTSLDLDVTQGVQCKTNGWLEDNGTQTRRVDLCPLEGPSSYTDGTGETRILGIGQDSNTRILSQRLSPIQNSALNTRRFENTDTIFDPLTDLNITTASLNELLANFSISVLTRNNFFDNVTVYVEEFHNVYHFADKVGFCVPYVLHLAIALVYAGIAVRALHKNGVPAADGGFLQIMVTTRGNTEMERLVVEQGPGSVEEMGKETLQLRVRLAEVEFEKEMGNGQEESGKMVRRRLAFRTEEEFGVGRKG